MEVPKRYGVWIEGASPHGGTWMIDGLARPVVRCTAKELVATAKEYKGEVREMPHSPEVYAMLRLAEAIEKLVLTLGGREELEMPSEDLPEKYRLYRLERLCGDIWEKVSWLVAVHEIRMPDSDRPD